jgi:hypothetical protein
MAEASVEALFYYFMYVIRTEFRLESAQTLAPFKRGHPVAVRYHSL